MLGTLLKSSLRSLKSKKGFSLLNIGGLALGLACFMLITVYVLEELSYDRHNEKYDRIHRMGLHLFLDGTETNIASVAAPVGPGLVEHFPEVSAQTRLFTGGFPVVRYADRGFSEERFFWADSTVFDVLTVPLVAGDPKTALVAPFSVVFSESMARKYFGNESPIGQTVSMDNRDDYTVTGVMKDFPAASHVRPDFLAAMSGREHSRTTSWATNNSYATYFLLDPSVSAAEFKEKLRSLAQTYVYPEVSQMFGVSAEQMLDSDAEFEYLVEPLSDVYLRSNLRSQFEPGGSILYVYLFAGIAIAILLIACINYINLSTAVSVQRAKEVGIRKAVGSSRGTLIAQFLIDSSVLSVIAMVIALTAVQMTLPAFSAFTGKELELPIFDNPYLIPGALAFAMLIGCLAGGYPALYLSSFNPVAVLKGGTVIRGSRSGLRNGLIVFQYSVSAVLLLASMIVYGQLDYIQKTNLGFSGDQVIIVEKTDDLGDRLDVLKRRIRNKSSVVAVGNSRQLFGEIMSDDLFREAGRPESENSIVFLNFTDEGYADTYRLELLEGRYFSPDQPGDEHAIVLNETAVKLLDLEDPIGAKLTKVHDEHEQTVIGVVKDFHVESFENPIKPYGFKYLGPDGHGRNLSVRVAGANVAGIIDDLSEEWYAVSNGQAFEYEFFDSVFEKYYLSEKSTGEVLIGFAGVSILIACLGLFGLAAFVTVQRTKEIGIRKSLGASASGIVLMLFEDFGKWILLANVIAWPIAYYMMNKWLQSFIFRTDITLLNFPIALGAGLVVAFLTIAYTTIRAATSNPVTALRYE
ncbi:MAG TPA: ABC transporter permease [Rhodothermales bacterium]|nr:ABC transporter permease [Rhodothermales bacterium]